MPQTEEKIKITKINSKTNCRYLLFRSLFLILSLMLIHAVIIGCSNKDLNRLKVIGSTVKIPYHKIINGEISVHCEYEIFVNSGSTFSFKDHYCEITGFQIEDGFNNLEPEIELVEYYVDSGRYPCEFKQCLVVRIKLRLKKLYFSDSVFDYDKDLDMSRLGLLTIKIYPTDKIDDIQKDSLEINQILFIYFTTQSIQA